MEDVKAAPELTEEDREKLKGMSRKNGKSAAAKGTKVSDALGSPREVTLDGRAYALRPLRLNDMCLIEGKYGDVADFLAEMDAGRLTAVRDFFWIMLQKIEPELTAAQVGEMIPVSAVELNGLLEAFLSASGLQTEGSSGNAAGAEPETEAAPSTGN